MTKLVWRKSSFSAENGACVEVAALDGHFEVRDSKAPEAGVVSVSRTGMVDFVNTMKTAGSTK